MNLYTEEVLREALEEFKSDSGFELSDVSEFLDYHRNTFQPYNPWSPIETAPKDGSEILVADEEDNIHHVFYDKGQWCIVNSYNYEHSYYMNPVNTTKWAELPKPTKS